MLAMKANKLRLILSAFLLILSLGAMSKTYLVSVGIADYSGFPAKINNLSLTTKDAKTIVELYSKNTTLDYSLLLDEKATKDRISRAIKKVFKNASENDIVVFFFSGHGYAGGFCAYDGNISYDAIRKSMSLSKCKNKMMFVDACRSGGMRVDGASASRALDDARNANVMLFLSSRNDESSIERRDMNNGFFTTYLQKGLKGNADTNRNRIITAKELFDYVHEGVTRISDGKQHPVMWGKFDDNMVVMEW